METPETPKNACLFCNYCHFKCSKKSEWNRHVSTLKHKRSVDGNILETPETLENTYSCKCGKKYSSHSGLWKHIKICDVDKINENNNINNHELYNKKDELIEYLMKENKEFKQLILEICKNGNRGTKKNREKRE
jgi:hypothetical protein